MPQIDPCPRFPGYSHVRARRARPAQGLRAVPRSRTRVDRSNRTGVRTNTGRDGCSRIRIGSRRANSRTGRDTIRFDLPRKSAGCSRCRAAACGTRSRRCRHRVAAQTGPGKRPRSSRRSRSRVPPRPLGAAGFVNPDRTDHRVQRPKPARPRPAPSGSPRLYRPRPERLRPRARQPSKRRCSPPDETARRLPRVRRAPAGIDVPS